MTLKPFCPLHRHQTKTNDHETLLKSTGESAFQQEQFLAAACGVQQYAICICVIIAYIQIINELSYVEKPCIQKGNGEKNYN